MTTQNQQNKDQQKTVVVFGCGGHGSSCLAYYIVQNPNTRFKIFLLPIDNGGCTGRMELYLRQSLESIQNNPYCSSFHVDKPAIALGDLKNNIKSWLNNMINDECRRRDINQIFDTRSTDKDELIGCFDRLSTQFPLLDRYENSFYYFVESYLSVVKEKHGDNITTSFGNLLLQMIYNQSNDSGEFFRILKINGMIPKNVDLFFLMDEQLELRAKDTSEQLVRGEANLDVHPNPIQLDSYSLYTKKGIGLAVKNVLQTNEHLKNIVELIVSNRPNTSILLSPGSLSNLFPVINLLREELNKTTLPVIYVTNAFIQSNEQNLTTQIKYMAEQVFKKAKSWVLTVKSDPFSLVDDLEQKEILRKAYNSEQKQPVTLAEIKQLISAVDKETKQLNIFPVLNMKQVEGAGLKYDTEQLNQKIQYLHKSECTEGKLNEVSTDHKRVKKLSLVLR